MKTITSEQIAQFRPLYVIAQEIRKTWPKVYFGAEPYLAAMECVDRITDYYGCDQAKDEIIPYFLANAGTWRGPDARRIKAELKAMSPYG